MRYTPYRRHSYGKSFDFHYYRISYRKYRHPTRHELICLVLHPKLSIYLARTSFLCFLDIILTLPSLPTHCSRRKTRLKTRGFSKILEIPVFTIGNPYIMKINGFSMGFHENLVKHCLCESTILRHGYRGAGSAAGAT